MSVSPVSSTAAVCWAAALDQVAQRLAARFSTQNPASAPWPIPGRRGGLLSV
jgi:hypothetical protein